MIRRALLLILALTGAVSAQTSTPTMTASQFDTLATSLETRMASIKADAQAILARNDTLARKSKLPLWVTDAVRRMESAAYLDAEQWWRWGRPRSVAPSNDPSSLPRLASTDITYLGAFRVPEGDYTGVTDNFTGGEPNGGAQVLAYKASSNTLLTNIKGGKIIEITIPTPVNSGTVASLNIASAVGTTAYDISEGAIASRTSNSMLTGLLIDSRLIGSATTLYGTEPSDWTHFAHSLTLSASSFQGPSTMTGGPGGNDQAFKSGYMTEIPTIWQTLLGGKALTGQCCVSRVERTSNGPSAFAFDPADIGTASPSSTPLLYYTLTHATIGDWSSQNDIYGAPFYTRGFAIIEGTRTLLYWTRNASPPYRYGQATNNPALDGTICDPAYPTEYCWYDPEYPTAKGQIGYPYYYQWLAYDLNDLVAVKNGTKQPWEPTPYAHWQQTLPTSRLQTQVGGMAYDRTNKRLYVVQALAFTGALSLTPIIHVFSTP